MRFPLPLLIGTQVLSTALACWGPSQDPDAPKGLSRSEFLAQTQVDLDKLALAEEEKRESEEIEKRAKWFRERRVGSDGRFVPGQYSAAIAARRAAEQKLRDRKPPPPPPPPSPPGGNSSSNWTPIGPSVTGRHDDLVHRYSYSGRVSALAVGPSGNRAYAGAANGGVWLYTAADRRWSPLDDYQTSPSPIAHVDALSVGALAVRFGAAQPADILYVGTGDQFSYYGIGILYSSNGGGSWTVEGAGVFTDTTVARLAIDPDDAAADRVVAATSIGVFIRSAATWTQVSNGFDNANGPASDVIVVGSGATRMFYAAFAENRVYSCPDPWTQPWTPVAGLAAGAGRLVLAGCESDPSVVYAYREDANCWRLVSGAFEFVSDSTGTLVTNNISANWYHLCLGVDPVDHNVIYIGDIKLSRATIKKQGQNWFIDTVTPYVNVHVDFHAVAFALDAAGTSHDANNLWVGSDAGVYQSTTPLSITSLASRNAGLANAQVYFLATRADTDTVALIGTQDIGVHQFLGEPAWLHMGQQADGGGVAIDPNDPYRMLMQHAVNSEVWSSLDGGRTWAQLVFPGANDPSMFVGAIRTTPVGAQPTLAFHGTTRLWMTPDWGTSWATFPSNTPGGSASDVVDGSGITAIAVASATRVYVATPTAVRHYDGPGTPWASTSITNAGLPGSPYITSLAPEVGDAFYAGLSVSSGSYVYFFDGASWHSTAFTLPVFAVAVDPASPTTIYVGSDVGVWRGSRVNLTWTWDLFSFGLPESGVTDLQIHQPTRLLRAATYGRGVWEVNLETAESGLSPELYVRVDYADNGRIRTTLKRSAFVEGAADPTMPPPTPGTLHHWKSPDIKVRRSSLNAPLASPVDFLDYATLIDDWVDTTTDQETADIVDNNQVFIEVHDRAPSGSASQVNVLALMTDASLGLPPLPADWVTHVNSLDTNPMWLAQSEWQFVDPNMPYRAVSGTIDVRNPGVVSYDNVTFGSLNLPAGHEHVCVATFVTASSDPIPPTGETSLDVITMRERHVAHRNLHLVPAGVQPQPPPSPAPYIQAPQVVTVLVCNPSEKPMNVDVEFERGQFHGDLVVSLPPRECEGLDGFHALSTEKLPQHLRQVHQEWFNKRDELLRSPPPRLNLRLAHKLERLAKLDRERVLLAEDQKTPTLRGLRLEAGEMVPMAMTLCAPSKARPGERFMIDVVERQGGQVLGGSTFVLAVYEDRRSARSPYLSGPASREHGSQH